jgi:acyl-CoA thioester hydrolase
LLKPGVNAIVFRTMIAHFGRETELGRPVPGKLAHFARYLTYLEAARAEALRSVGLPAQSVAAISLGATLLNAKLQYRFPARFDDVLNIATWISELSDRQHKWMYEVRLDSDASVVLTAETVHTWTGTGQSLRAEATPRWVVEALDRLKLLASV